MHPRLTLRSPVTRAWPLQRPHRPRLLSDSVFRARAAAAPVSDKELNFVDELKRYAMSLHRRPPKKEQEQKDKEEKDGPKPFEEWIITAEGYLRFLAESRRVFSAIEEIVQTNDDFAMFRDTGLDRVKALNHDIAWLSAEYNLPIPDIPEDGPGAVYARELHDISAASVPLFICHFYNYYLAHTAGGRMIGKKAADMALGGGFERLAFYQYEHDLKVLVLDFKKLLNTVALDWTDDQRTASIEETPNCFKMSGAVMGTLFSTQE